MAGADERDRGVAVALWAPGPCLDWFRARDRRPTQVVMLAIVSVFFIAVMGWLKLRVTSRIETVWLYSAMRWGLGEFLWCWLAADHAFSTLWGMRRTGMMRDLAIALGDRGDVARGFMRATLFFLGTAIVVCGLGELAVPHRHTLPLALVDDPSFAPLARVGVPLVLTLSQLATLALALGICTRVSLESQVGDHVAWASALWRLMWLLLATLALPLVIVGVIWWLAKPSPTMLTLIALVVLSLAIPAKLRLARVAWRDAIAAMQADSVTTVLRSEPRACLPPSGRSYY